MEMHNDMCISAEQGSGWRDGDESLNRAQRKPYAARIKGLINVIVHYQDVYPVVQRGIQFLCRELCDENCGNTNEEEVVRAVQAFVEAGTLEGIISAMANNLDSPAFIRSCFELLEALVNKANALVAGELWKTDILAVLNKIVHSVMYLNEPACVQLGIHVLSKLVRSLDSIGNELWAQLVAVVAQAMLTNSLDEALQLECMLNLKMLFQLKSDTTVPATSANIILKTVDQYNRHATQISKSFASVSVVVIFRIFETSSQTPRGYPVLVLAAVLHHYQLLIGLNETHRVYVETHIQQSLQAAVTDTLTQLVEQAVPSAELSSNFCLNELQNATMKLLLSVVWREEAQTFLSSGGFAVLTTILASEFEANATIGMALAQTLYYVSVHWPDEMWSEIQISGPGLVKWLNAKTKRCEDDGVLHYLLAMIKAFLNCEGFLTEFTANNGIEVFNFVLHKHRQLPLCTRVIVKIILAVPDMCPATFSRELCCSLADALFSFEAKHLILLECVTALNLLISRQSDREIALSALHVRGIIRVMRSNLTDAQFTAEILNLVASTLLDPSTRAALIDEGLLQVVAKAICTHQWSHSESIGMNARQIICDTAHKFDVSRNLSTLEPLAHVVSGHSFSSPAISVETIDTCCAMIGALACVKPLLPLLIQDGAIKCMTGVLRFCKQEVVVRSEGSFIQLVSTCFHALSNIVNAPVVMNAMDSAAREDTIKALDGHSICSQLVDSAAEDAIIGCLEEALRVKNSSSVLMDSGCRLLRTVLTFPIMMHCETECRWIAVATSVLQRHSTRPKTRELLFATTLVVLSRGKYAVEGARGQHVKMMKVILGILDGSIQREGSCVLLEAECAGAIRVLEELAKQSGPIADTFISKYLGILGKLMGICIFSPSASAQDCLLIFDNAIAFFATTGYVNRLLNRLDMCMSKEGFTELGGMMDVAEDFKALRALLFSSQAKKTIDAYHRLFKCIAATVENGVIYAQTLQDYAPFLLELGCLSSQLLSSAQREETINTVLCHFAEDTVWHSMRWIAALADRGSSEIMFIIEFVLLRIISGYSILEPALLLELLESLNYLLRCSQCREIVLASPHARDLQNVVWELVCADIVHLDSEAENYDIAVPLLGIISSLLSSFPDELFSIRSKENGCELLVRFCLGALDHYFSNPRVDLAKCALMEEVLQATGVILHNCIQLGAEYARSIVQHRATQRAFCIPVGTETTENKSCVKWCVVVLGAFIQSHGLLYAERLLNLSPNPIRLLVSLIGTMAQNAEYLPWNSFVACIAMANDSAETVGWQLPCSTLFEQLARQTKCLVHEQATVTSSSRVNKHISDTIALLSFKYGQLCSNASRNEEGCLQAIAQSGTTFHDLFLAASSFGVLEYSAVVGLHLKIARLVGVSTEVEMSSIKEAAIRIRQLLSPICMSDEALADYLDLATVVYLPSTARAASWLFIDAAGQGLSVSMQRLATGLVRPQCLENSLLRCFSSLRTIYSTRWESGEVDSVLELLRIFSPDRWSQQLLLESVLKLPQGLLHLFELARTAKSSETHVMIMNFLFQHLNDFRYKTQRIGELELSMILSIIKRNIAGRVGDTSQRKWGEGTGSEILRSALETLKLFVRRKNYAVVCSDLGGIATLYDVLCAPSQYQGTIKVALEICCFLAGYGANLTQETTSFVLQLLLVSVDSQVDSSRSGFAFLVLEYFLANSISDLTLPMIQQCRTQIVPKSARSNEEDVFIQQLYIIRQKFAPLANISKPPTACDAPALQKALSEREIREIIISNCRSFVQCSNGKDEYEYIDVNSSEKSLVEPLEYSQLREAIDQLSFVLGDPDMVMNRSYVAALVPALCETLALHTNTTTTMCTVMQVLGQIAFVNPSIVVFNEEVNIQALFASFSLHHRSSLEFTRYLSRFCNSITADLREDDEDLVVSLLPLLLELLQLWKSDFEIVDQNLATLSNLLDIMRIKECKLPHCGDIPALTNAAVTPYMGNTLTAWNWMKCTLAMFNKLDKMRIESVQDTVATVMGVIRMFMSHNCMVEKAVLVLVCVYVETHQLPFRNLIESDGVEMLLTCLQLNVNNNSIAHSCLKLLVRLTSDRDTAPQAVDQLLTAAAAAPILLVAKKNPDSSLICGMCIELVYRMVESFSKYSGKKQQVSLLGGLSRRKSELLTSLLEADIIPLIFDLLDNYSCRGHDHLQELLLLLLKSLTKDERIRESAEVLHGLHELKQTIDRARESQIDCAVVELAIDCLVNLACSDRAIGHGWREISMWLLQLAENIHNLKTDSSGMCVEKLIGVLGRLSVDSAICKMISPKGSFIVLELLTRVGSDYSLEQALYGLLCSLCDDIECAQVLIIYDAIKITAERITCHVNDEETLLSSLCFFDLLVLNSGESYPALVDEVVFQVLDSVIYTYPETSGSPLYHLASTIRGKVSALDYQSTRTKPVILKSTKVPAPQVQISDLEQPFRNLLREGGTFRVLWEARPGTAERIQVKLAPSGEYLLFRRQTSTHLPRVERIFVSQLEVCPQRSLVNPGSPSSPSKKTLAQSLVKENFEGDHVLRLKVRDEDVLIKTSSTRERVHWDQALQWLVSHRETCTRLNEHF